MALSKYKAVVIAKIVTRNWLRQNGEETGGESVRNKVLVVTTNRGTRHIRFLLCSR